MPGASRVGLVIPVIDEAATIAGVVRAVPRDVIDEVIVVDGGSRDDTVAGPRAAGGGGGGAGGERWSRAPARGPRVWSGWRPRPIARSSPSSMATAATTRPTCGGLSGR